MLPWLAAPLTAGRTLRGHATLIHGPSGVGQFELAYRLALEALCEDRKQPEPCGVCTGCQLMNAHAHPDFLLLAPAALREGLGWTIDDDSAKRDKPSRQIRIGEIRAAIDWTHTTASRGGAKVLLIHSAEAMNEVSANALLKTLEEPGASQRLWLTTAQAQRLLPTLRSRCQHLPVPTPAAAEAVAWLTTQGVTEPLVLLAAAGGRPLDAFALHADGVDGARWRALPRQLRQGDATAMIPWGVARAVDSLQRLAHDLACRAVGAPPRFFAVADLPESPVLTGILAWQRALKRVARHAEHPWHAALTIEALTSEGAQMWADGRTTLQGR